MMAFSSVLLLVFSWIAAYSLGGWLLEKVSVEQLVRVAFALSVGGALARVSVGIARILKGRNAP